MVFFMVSRRGKFTPAGDGSPRFGPAGALSAAPPALTSAGSWDQAELDFRLAEFGALPGDNHVAHHGDLIASAKAVAVDGGNCRKGEFLEGLPVVAALVS